jgi:hypothetical protein
MATQHVESKEIPGISQALVDKHGAEALRKLIHPRGAPQFGLIYDRSATRDGSDITSPFPASRHVSDNWRRGDNGAGWLAIRLVEEYATPEGGLFRDVVNLPNDLRVAGDVA